MVAEVGRNEYIHQWDQPMHQPHYSSSAVVRWVDYLTQCVQKDHLQKLQIKPDATLF